MNFKLHLAPLAGVTDSPFRRICIACGADTVCTEMISAKGLYYNDDKTSSLMAFDDSERPIGIQFFGHEPDIMDYAVKKAAELSPQYISLNMGCPVQKVVKGGDGSALMKSPKTAAKVIEAAVKAAQGIPVSVKFRAGWDEEHINACEFAKMCCDSGASEIVVHPRTRQALYTGRADHSVTAQVKAVSSVPVIANGDVFTPEDCARVMTQTGADGVMIARGACGNPFIFAEIKEFYATGSYTLPSAEEKIAKAIEHLHLMCESSRNSRHAVTEARKHMAWYLKGMRGGAACKNLIFRAETEDEVKGILEDFIARYDKSDTSPLSENDEDVSAEF